jgi:hypothetical protein
MLKRRTRALIRFTQPMEQVCTSVILFRLMFPITPLKIYVSPIFRMFPQSHIIYSLFINSLEIIMSFVSFTILAFLLRIGIRGTFFLEVAASMGYMSLMYHPLLLRSSVVSVLHHHSGTLALVIRRLPLFAIFFIVMSYWFSLVVLVIYFVMPVNKARVISFLF